MIAIILVFGELMFIQKFGQNYPEWWHQIRVG